MYCNIIKPNICVYKFYLKSNSKDFDLILYHNVLGHEKTIGLGNMFQKISLMGRFGIITSQYILMEMMVKH